MSPTGAHGRRDWKDSVRPDDIAMSDDPHFGRHNAFVHNAVGDVKDTIRKAGK
jgi:hypothetical protein